jgi:hypothetical protein
MNDIPFHKHNGVDTPRVDGKSLGPFAVLNFHPTTATWPFGEATIALSENGGTRRMNTMINGALRYVVLT